MELRKSNSMHRIQWQVGEPVLFTVVAHGGSDGTLGGLQFPLRGYTFTDENVLSDTFLRTKIWVLAFCYALNDSLNDNMRLETKVQAIYFCPTN